MTTVTVMYWYGSREVDGVMTEGAVAECPRCGWRTFVEGTDGTEIERCLLLLREECPRQEGNTYTIESFLAQAGSL